MRLRRPPTRELVFPALLFGGAALGSGCVLVTDDETARFEVSWDLLAAADDQPVTQCPTEGATAEVVSTVVETGEQFVDCFPCGDFEGVTADLPLDAYDIHVNIVDAGPGECGAGDPPLLAQSAPQPAELVAEDQQVPLDFDFYVDGGFFQVAWTLSDASGELACSEVQQGGVGVLSTLVGPNTAFDDVFDCAGDGTCGDQCGTTAPLPVGDYEVVVDLRDQNNDSLTSCGDQMSRTVDFGNQLVDLGTVDCPIQ